MKQSPSHHKKGDSDTCGGIGCHLLPSVHKNTMIFLHGLGDQGESYVPFAQLLINKYPDLYEHTKFIFPTAPTQPVTLFDRIPVPAWADVVSLSTPPTGYAEACPRIEDIIKSEREKHKIPASKIFLGGFSQGGAVAYMTLFRSKEPLGGIIALSTWTPVDPAEENPVQVQCPDIFKTPIFHGHGFIDEVVNIKFGIMSVRLLKSIGFDVKFVTYSQATHEISPEAYTDMSEFLRPYLKSEKSDS